MAVPNYRRTWLNLINHDVPYTAQLAYTRYQLWALKAFLKGEIGPAGLGTWEHVASSDGVAVSTTTDLWGAAFDETKIVRGANGGAARSWIILRGPAVNGVRPYIHIDFAGTADYQASFAFATTYAGNPTVSNPNFAAGTSDAWGYFVNGTSLTGNWGGLQINGALASLPVSRVHGGRADNGSFWFSMTENASATVKWGIFCLGYRPDAVTLGANEPQPFFTGVNMYAQSYIGKTANATARSLSEAGASSGNGSGGCGCRESLLVAVQTPSARSYFRAPIMTPGFASGTSPTDSYTIAGSSPGATASGVRGMIPAIVCHPSHAVVGGMRGIIEDVYVGLIQVMDGTLTPPLNPHFYVYMGGLWLPCSEQPIFG